MQTKFQQLRYLYVLSALLCISTVADTAFAEKLKIEITTEQSVTNPANASSQAALIEILGLDQSMRTLYANAAIAFEQKFLDQHPVVLALFSGSGGKLILYQPGQTPIKAPPVSDQYQILKSIAHTTLAISQVLMAELVKPSPSGWQTPLQNYRDEMKGALVHLAELSVPEHWRDTMRDILVTNIGFIDQCLQSATVTHEGLMVFGEQQSPHLKQMIDWAGQVQVEHWMAVMTQWRSMLGEQWPSTYGASNAIYVTRQNNVLFSVLAQFFEPEAMNDRLFLFETTSFNTSPKDLLRSLTRIVSDRRVGEIFFGNSRVMDYELMGGAARRAIIEQMAARGKPPQLPPLVPFGSTQWPMLITPGNGASTLLDLP